MSPKEWYAAKLRDPRWQKKRLGVLQSAKWRCSACDCEDRELHVHHLKYVGANPWDTPDEYLECLCDSCHQTREALNKAFAEMMREASTKHVIKWGERIAGLSRTYDTAPKEIQRVGPASFIFCMMGMAIDAFWEKARAAS